uniref:Ribonuclease pancreatic gamma-type n=1 Tax=Rattus fuscipes TaxID=10119 RepID=RNS1G_RATFU|nr:RecName: Full=Ribonuclease pancreatic gamma-type; AltName: Full=RNase 1 gamma; Flags: Precursor [Rattus fuscipes]CAC86438.1 pancreatic ribonuclease gamma [Rattus fuscipes]
MGLEKSFILFSLLVLVLGCVQPSLVGESKESPSEKFKRRHMDEEGPYQSSPTYCNQMMKDRGMTSGRCKPLNTFVHESWAKVKAICSQDKVTCKNGKSNCHKSISTLNITDCLLMGSSKYPKCDYSTTARQKHSIIACDGNPYVPVHYDATV